MQDVPLDACQSNAEQRAGAKNIAGPMIVHGLYNFLFDFFLVS